MEHVYILYREQECGDHYYEPYHHMLHVFATLEDAVAEAERCIEVARAENIQTRYFVEAQRVLPPGSRDVSGEVTHRHGSKDRDPFKRLHEVVHKYVPTAADLAYEDEIRCDL